MIASEPQRAVVRLPECTHRPPCPGCPRYALAGIPERAAAALAALARETGAVLEETVEGPPLAHRQRARLMVRGRSGSPKVGLFQSGSHRIVDVPHCQVHHPLVNEAAAALKLAIRATGVAPYADAPHRGVVRALQVVVERSSQQAQIVVVTNSDEPAASAALLDALVGQLGERLHSAWWNGNPDRTNTILGNAWERRSGEEAVCEEIGGARVFFPPAAFGQSNLALADRIVERIHDFVPGGARVCELYAGCGAIGLGLVRRGHTVVFNEASVGGLRGLALGVDALPAATSGRARIVAGNAADHVALVREADAVIVDPPRRGLEPLLRDELAGTPPARLVYLSCDRERFEVDARGLVAHGRLRLARMVPFALFPFTDHVETLALFEAT